MQLAIIFAVAALFFVLERVVPGRPLPNAPSWFVRAGLLNAAQLGVVLLAGVTWNQWLHGPSLFHIASLPPLTQGALGWFVGTFVFYWWHRVRHHSNFLWRVLHQIHHSATRIETITSFYKHPLEIAANSVLSSLLIFIVLGGSIEAAAWFNVFAATGEMLYHANIRTPRWWGYFMQRPEHHSIHHQLDVHNFNFGDITLWDRLFGTFREASDFAPACGFAAGREEHLGRMLVFKDEYSA